MAVTARSGSSGNTLEPDGKSIKVSRPAAAVAGDLLVVILAGNGDNADNHAAPVGWVRVAASSRGTGSDEHGQSVWYRKLLPEDKDVIAWTFTDADGVSGGAMGYLCIAYIGGKSVTALGLRSVLSSSDYVAGSVTAGLTHMLVQTNFASPNAAIWSRPAGEIRSTSSSGSTPARSMADFVPTVSQTEQPTWSTTYVASSIARLLVIVENTAPNAPTGLSPSLATSINKDIAQRFSWSFSDPDAGDTQSAYDLRYRQAGTTTWTTVSGGATQYHDFTAGTFTAGDWEWQARTTDNGGLTGPWSSSAFFTATTAPAGPTITAPTNGGTISSDPYTVTWTAAEQDAYQLRTVADDGTGSPDTATVYTDTGTVTSSSDRSRSVAFTTNDLDVHVQLRRQVDGLWSDWISVAATVSYTTPATPSVVVDEDNPTGAISIQASHPSPSGAEPTVVTVDWWRREIDADGNPLVDGDEGIRIAANTAPTAAFTDWRIGSGRHYAYRARAWGANEVSSWSDWSEAGDGIIAADDILDGGSATTTFTNSIDGGDTGVTAPDTTAPTAPTNVAASATSDSTVSVTWTAATDNTSTQAALIYRVYRDGSIIATTAAGATFYEDTGLIAATTYSYTVSAVDQAGNESTQSTAAGATTDATPPAGSDDYLSHSLFIDKTDLDGQATSGTYWTQLETEADRTDHAVAEFDDNNGRFGIQTYAKALRYARLKVDGVADATIDGYRTEVAARLQDFVDHTLLTGGSTLLGHARQLAPLIFAADLINLVAHDATLDADFRSKVTTILTREDATATDGFTSLVDGSMSRPNNIGMSCRISLCAAYLYLDDTANLDANVIIPMRRWLGDTSYHVGEFEWNANQTWQADPSTSSTWQGVVGAGVTRDGHSFDGIQPEDQRRGTPASYDSADFPNTLGTAYIYTAASDAAWILLMLHRAGYTGALAWSDDAAQRAIERLLHFEATYSAKGYTHIANGLHGAQLTALCNFLYGTAHTIVDPANHYDAYGASVGYSHFLFTGRTL